MNDCKDIEEFVNFVCSYRESLKEVTVSSDFYEYLNSYLKQRCNYLADPQAGLSVLQIHGVRIKEEAIPIKNTIT